MAAVAPQKLAGLVLMAVLSASLPLVTAQQPPPNYSYDDLPDTSFSCEGRVVGGYYADVEAGCQMFHVCGTSQRTSFRFLCPNNTVFDQQHLICASWFQVSCDRSTVLYARNFEIFKKDSEQEVEFNALDEEDLPALDDYDFDYQLTSGGANRFFSSAGRSGGGSRPASRAPVTRPRVTRPPATRAPATRAPASRAPRRFDLSSAATTPRPDVSSTGSVSFRDQSTFATASTAAVPSAPSRQPFLPTPLPPLSPTAAAAGSFSSPRFQPSARPTSAPARFDAPRVTLGEFRATSPRPATFFTSPRPAAPSSLRPSAAAAASFEAGTSFTTPVPVFTTTGKFPFGFTSVPQTNFAFGNGGSFSFGTGVDNRAPPATATTASSRGPSPSQPPTAPELADVSNDVRDQVTDFVGTQTTFDRTRGRGGPSAATTPRAFSARTSRPTTPTPPRAAAVSSASPFARGPTVRPTTRPTTAPIEPRRTVSPVAGRFFGANVLPEAAAAGEVTRPRGRGRNNFRLNSVRANSVNDVDTDDSAVNEIGNEAVEATTATPGGRFSATVPTRSPSTRLSAGGGTATTFRPRQPGGGRRRRPPAPAAASAAGGATLARRRGSRRRGGARTRPSAAQPTGGNSAGLGATVVRQRVSSANTITSPRPVVTRGSRRPAVARTTPRPTLAPLNTPPPAEFSNEIDAAPAPKPTRRPRPRGRGSRRFNPRLPGGDLKPVKFVRNRGGRGRAVRPTAPPPTTPSPRRFISDIDDVEALTDELNLLDEQELLEELEREDQRFRDGPEANNRSIDSAARRQRLPTRGTTPAPLQRGPAPTRPTPLQRGPAPTRPAPLQRGPAPTRPTPLQRGPAPTRAAPRRPPATAAPQVIRKRIRVRGRPSRRPKVTRRTTTPRPTTTTTTTPPTPPRPRATTPGPEAEPSTLPTNKEASNLGRQSGGFFLRPKLQLSSALPTDLQTRRLNDVNALAAERTGRSRNTSPVAFNRAVRSTTRAPDARLSDILFASSSPGGARRGDADYDYQYYDSDFLLEHQDLVEDADDLFQTLSRKTRWT